MRWKFDHTKLKMKSLREALGEAPTVPPKRPGPWGRIQNMNMFIDKLHAHLLRLIKPQFQIVWGFTGGSCNHYASIFRVDKSLRLKLLVNNWFVSWLEGSPQQPVRAGHELQHVNDTPNRTRLIKGGMPTSMMNFTDQLATDAVEYSSEAIIATRNNKVPWR